MAAPIAGIDYGSKLAGTTVIVWLEQGALHFAKSVKAKDADAFIRNWTQEYPVAKVFLDAPLSLLGKYRDLPHCEDYFYRIADKALHAMSPMFLGGLTARALQLADGLRGQGIEVVETYPAHLAKLLQLPDYGYKKEKANIPLVTQVLAAQFSCAIPELSDWHHVDALLALLSGLRHQSGTALHFGEAAEGVIVV